MYILFPLMLAVPLVGLARWTDGAYRALWVKKRCQIAVDNSLIRAGGVDRATFGRLATASRELARMHRAHHVLHACARVAATAAKCAGGDLAMEKAIDSLATTVWHAAQGQWLATTAGIVRDWNGWGESGPAIVGRFRRSPRLPARARRCAKCGLVSGWDVDSARAETRGSVCEAAGDANATEGAIEWTVSDGRLQYRLAR